MIAGVVAIGRNEGQRLRACLLSAQQDSAAVVYVDSGSTDDSVEMAKSLGAHVVNLDLSKPFTAARARNEGFAKLREIAPAVEFVQFVDGDCEIIEGWMTKAVAELKDRPKTAIVCGRRRERFPAASVYNRLCDMEWDTPVGLAKACGGDAMIRVAALVEVGGYDPRVIAGEEPEMCVRLRARGWAIERLDEEMTLHDAGMTRFSQWWKRNVRAGHAYAQANAMHGSPPERFRRRELRSIQFWATVPLVLTCGGVALLGAFAPRWCGLGLTPLLAYPALAAKIALRRIKCGQPLADSTVYALAVVTGKFAQYQGVRKFRAARRRGKQSEIIEYKSLATPWARQS
jgi:GT2 family glycosyltransferase